MSNGRKKCALLAKALSPSIPPLLHIYQGSEISFWGEGENGGKHSESKEKGRVMVVAEKAERGRDETNAAGQESLDKVGQFSRKKIC